MRIVVDVSPLSHERTGVGNYIRGSLLGIAEASAGQDELVAFAPAGLGGRREIGSALRGIAVERKLPVLPAAHAFRTAWSRIGRPPLERFVGPLDVFHFSDWMYPPQRGGIRSTMIHDLVPIHHPDWVHPRTRRMHGAKYRHAAETCDVVIVNSQFTGDDVAATLGVDPARIHVAHPGVEPMFSPEGERFEIAAGRPYALAVATNEPRKNLARLAEAYALLDPAEITLVIVGGEGWGSGPELDAPGIVKLGYSSVEELPRLFRGASAFVYPSLFEGFGMPVVEAMACGAPCVVSSHPSLDEASGDAAVRVDPHDPASIAAGIEHAVAERDELAARGLAHVRQFTWLANGEAHLAAWRAAA